MNDGWHLQVKTSCQTKDSLAYMNENMFKIKSIGICRFLISNLNHFCSYFT